MWSHWSGLATKSSLEQRIRATRQEAPLEFQLKSSGSPLENHHAEREPTPGTDSKWESTRELSTSTAHPRSWRTSPLSRLMPPSMLTLSSGSSEQSPQLYQFTERVVLSKGKLAHWLCLAYKHKKLTTFKERERLWLCWTEECVYLAINIKMNLYLSINI